MPDDSAQRQPRGRGARALRRMRSVAAAIELLDGVASVPRDEWNALVAGESPFLEWEWLASLEEAGCVGAEHRLAAAPARAARGRAGSSRRARST